MLNAGYILDGKYEVVKILGQGGMGTVYLCKNIRLNNMWAIKEIMISNNDGTDFPVEIGILKDLKHPSIPRIVDMFHEGGKTYIVEDYIEGENIESIVKREGCMKSNQLCEIALELCNIIGYLHKLNPPVIYRDLKPSNIILTPDGKVVLIDFGISRIYKYGRESDTVVMGSKGYAAPEQYGAAQSGRQTDIYGLGATMYFMHTGEAPSWAAKLKDTGIEGIIKKAMNPDMKNRYKSIDEMSYAIRFINKNSVKTMLLDKKPGSFQKTAMLDDNMGRNAKHCIHKKTIKILAGVIIFFVLIFCMEYLLWRNKNIEPASSKSTAAASKNTAASSSTSTAKDNPAAEKEPSVPVPAAVQDIDIHGVIYRNSPIVIGSNNDDRGKNKKKHDSNQTQDIFYNVDPKARAGRFDNKFIIEAEYIEFLANKPYLYFVIDNTSGYDIELPLKNMYLTIDEDNDKKAKGTEVLKIPDGTLDMEIKIPFEDFELANGTIKIHMNVSSTDSNIENNIQLTIDVK